MVKTTEGSNIGGVRYTDGYDIYLTKKRDRRRHRQSGDRKKLSGTEKKNAAMFFEKYEEWL